MPDLARPVFFWLRDAFRREIRITQSTECRGVEHTRMVNQGCSRVSVKNERARKKHFVPKYKVLFKFGGTSGGRTHDKRIKSPLLYQLSYGPYAEVTCTAARLKL
jgi:hypothetical protein